MTDLEYIINKAYKDARRKITNEELVSRVFEFNYPIKLEIKAIREKFMDRFVIYGLRLLNKRYGVYPSQDHRRYRNLLFHALNANGARKIEFFESPYPYIRFGNLYYEVKLTQDDGVLLSTFHYHDSINVYADPWKVAELMAMIHAYPIPDTLYEEIYIESCELYRIYEMTKSSVHKLIDDLLEGNRFNFWLDLCGTERFKLSFFEGPYIVADIYTDLQCVRGDILRVLTNHKQNPPSWFKDLPTRHSK